MYKLHESLERTGDASSDYEKFDSTVTSVARPSWRFGDTVMRLACDRRREIQNGTEQKWQSKNSSWLH